MKTAGEPLCRKLGCTLSEGKLNLCGCGRERTLPPRIWKHFLKRKEKRIWKQRYFFFLINLFFTVSVLVGHLLLQCSGFSLVVACELSSEACGLRSCGAWT